MFFYENDSKCNNIHIIPSHTPLKNNMTLENQPFEDVFPIEHGDFPASHVSLPGGTDTIFAPRKHPSKAPSNQPLTISPQT